MLYTAKVVVCSESHTKHSTQYTWWYVKKQLGFERFFFWEIQKGAKSHHCSAFGWNMLKDTSYCS